MNAAVCVAIMGLVLITCSRSGTLSGEVFVWTPAGRGNPLARISVSAIRPTEAFEHDWAAGLVAFQAEVGPARTAQRAAAASVEEARLAWDRTLVAGRAGGNPRHRGARTSTRERQSWERLRAAEQVLFLANRRVWEMALKYDAQADSLLAKHTAQRVQTDATGHYVLAGLPVGKIFLYTRLLGRDQMRVWFVPVLVRAGVQQLDLTEANRGGWPFVQ